MKRPSFDPDPCLDQAAVSDESLLAVHEKFLGRQPDEKARYKLLPLNLLFIFSGLIFFAGTYLNRYAGLFDPHVFDENAMPTKAGAEPPAKPLTPEEVIALGKRLYNDAACNTCHQVNGVGQPGAIPPLVGSEWVTGSEERLIRIVIYGVTGEITVAGTKYSSMMPAFGKGVPASMKNWSDDRVAAVLTYIRHEFGNQAAPISTEKVAEVHAKEGAHKPFEAAELLKLP
jgi:mono/diheme cytochrome c family protein